MKLKDLQRLNREVSRACSFAEEIKAKVEKDLKTIQELDEKVVEAKSTILILEKRLKEVNKVLSNLYELLS